ncbi:glycoside hydrolase family 128 protein [Hypoxylon sp. NC1633]|nr:glycoside hydrolase family 128 protein [Hypoxylon sp. NC1633]
MYFKFSILALCAAASVTKVTAASLHRHMHPKREIIWAATDTVVITDYVTVTVTAGEEAPTAQVQAAAEAAQTTSAVVKGQEIGEGGQYHHSGQFVPAVSSTTSSSTSVVESTTSTIEGASPTTEAAEPTYAVASPTTLLTSVKTTPVVETPTTIPAVESTSTESPSTEATSPETTPVVLYPTTTAQAPATTPTTAPAAPSTTAPSTGSGSSKRGAAYNDPTLVSALLGLTNKISWAYNWGSDSSGLKADVAYYPMLWSPASEHSSNWDTKAEAAIASGSDCLLSFNEPDIGTQANLSPDVAAAGHIQYMNKYAGKARISSPAISSSESPNQGVDWLNKFFAACDGKCQVDFCTAHWYGPGGPDGAKAFLDHVEAVHTACENKNVWVTEFAAESGDVDTFMQIVTQKLDSDEFSYVEKYSYFMLSASSLMTSATTLSSFGKIFAGI